MFLSYFISVVLHELAHAKVASLRGYKLKKIVLMPYGAVLQGKENWSRRDSLYIAIAGPASNACIVIIILALWWLTPNIYTYTYELFRSNISLLIFNLLPCFPLDGGRIALSLAEDKLKFLKKLKIFGIIVGILFIGLGIATLWFVFNITLIIGGCFLIVGAISGNEQERYYHVLSNLPFSKNYLNGVVCMEIIVSCETSLLKLLEFIKPTKKILFVVVDNELKIIKKIKEEDVKNFMIKYPLTEKIGNLL